MKTATAIASHQNQHNARATGIITIDCSALRQNYQTLQNQVGSNCTVAGVVKANAYGIGANECADIIGPLGCNLFFVATLDEAISLRNHLNHTSAHKPEIIVLDGVFAGADDEYFQHSLTPVLNSLDDIEYWKKIAQNKNQKLSAHIHFDTGMNRLGLGYDETKILTANKNHLLDGLSIQTIMSHFACADEKDHPLTEQQFERFSDIARHFPDIKKSLANSPGTFRNTKYHFDMVRPGRSLYGRNPCEDMENPMQRVASLHVRIQQIREAKKGESVGYGASHNFKKNATLATVSMGYADGFFRYLSNKGNLYWNGIACPVLGRVSMDLVTVDLTHLEQKPQKGDLLEVIGPNQSADNLAASANTIGYEILASLGPRYFRNYI